MTSVSHSNGVGVAGVTFIADIDIVTSRGLVETSAVAQGNIFGASGIIEESERSIGGIARAGSIAKECSGTGGRICGLSVDKERPCANTRVEAGVAGGQE